MSFFIWRRFPVRDAAESYCLATRPAAGGKGRMSWRGRVGQCTMTGTMGDQQTTTVQGGVQGHLNLYGHTRAQGALRHPRSKALVPAWQTCTGHPCCRLGIHRNHPVKINILTVFEWSVVLHHLCCPSHRNSNKVAMAWIYCGRHEEREVDGKETPSCSISGHQANLARGCFQTSFHREAPWSMWGLFEQKLGLKDQEQN